MPPANALIGLPSVSRIVCPGVKDVIWLLARATQTSNSTEMQNKESIFLAVMNVSVV
jgi:hypothetical protein